MTKMLRIPLIVAMLIALALLAMAREAHGQKYEHGPQSDGNSDRLRVSVKLDEENGTSWIWYSTCYEGVCTSEGTNSTILIDGDTICFTPRAVRLGSGEEVEAERYMQVATAHVYGCGAYSGDSFEVPFNHHDYGFRDLEGNDRVYITLRKKTP